jgi:hypothetical protein
MRTPIAAIVAVLATVAAIDLKPTTGNAMSTMVSATGPYNLTCNQLAKAAPAARERALAYAQGYFAALNMNAGPLVNLQERWRELNAYILRKCTDKSNPYLYRRFVGDFVEEVLAEMRKPTFSPRADQLPVYVPAAPLPSALSDEALRLRARIIVCWGDARTAECLHLEVPDNAMLPGCADIGAHA